MSILCPSIRGLELAASARSSYRGSVPTHTPWSFPLRLGSLVPSVLVSVADCNALRYQRPCLQLILLCFGSLLSTSLSTPTGISSSQDVGPMRRLNGEGSFFQLAMSKLD